MTDGVELKVVVPKNKEKIVRRGDVDEDNIIDIILKLMEKV